MRSSGSTHTWYGRHQGELDAFLGELGVLANTSEGHFGLFCSSELKAIAGAGSAIEGICGFPAMKDDESRYSWIMSPRHLPLGNGAEDGAHNIRLCCDHLPKEASRDAVGSKLAHAIAPVVRMLKKDFHLLNTNLELLMQLAVAYRQAGVIPMDLGAFAATAERLPGTCGWIALKTDANSASPCVAVFHSADPGARKSAPKLVGWLERNPTTLSMELLDKLGAYGARVVTPDELLPPNGIRKLIAKEAKGKSILAVHVAEEEARYYLLCIAEPVSRHDMVQYTEGLLGDLARKRSRATTNNVLRHMAVPTWLERRARNKELCCNRDAAAAILNFLDSSANVYTDLRPYVLGLAEDLSSAYAKILPDPLLPHLIAEFERLEGQLGQIPRYRDHFLHEIVVFLLGLVIIHDLGSSRMQGTFRSTYGTEVSWTDDEIEAAWFETCMLHDIAYPLALAEPWFDHVLSSLGLDALVAHSGLLKFNSARFAGEFEGEISRLGDSLAMTMRPSELTAEFAAALYRDNLVERLDHGVLSALVTMTTAKQLGQSVARHIATAIGVHDNLLLSPGALRQLYAADESDFASQVETLAADTTQSFGQITLERHPLACMLVFCDTAHEWGRRSPTQSGQHEGIHYLKAEQSEILAGIAVGPINHQRRAHMEREKQIALRRISSSQLRFRIDITSVSDLPS